MKLKPLLRQLWEGHPVSPEVKSGGAGGAASRTDQHLSPGANAAHTRGRNLRARRDCGWAAGMKKPGREDCGSQPCSR